MLAVLDKWQTPRYLSRIWTIYEQHVAIQLKVPVSMLLPHAEGQSLLECIETGASGIYKVCNTLLAFDSKSAKATFEEDERVVKAMIEETIGFEMLDRQITTFLVSWVKQVLGVHMQSLMSKVQKATRSDFYFFEARHYEQV